MNVSREIGAFVNSTFRVKIGIKSPQAYNREQFQIGQGGYNMKVGCYGVFITRICLYDGSLHV